MSATGMRPAAQSHHSFAGHSANTKQAQLATAYQELGKELGSDRIKVVGGYTLGRVIGEGTFGSVHLATHRLTGTRCAIKKVPKSATPQLTREIHHHRRLHHPHIVHLHEIIATENSIWLVSELCSGGELFDYLVERGRLLEGEARRIFGELVTAVGYMHSHGVVHRDLKLENVLLDGELRVKLGDLGFAREFQRGRLMETFCGTTGYASPEMLKCIKYLGVETDIWSLGIILYILLCGGLPFDDDDENVMKEMIIKGEYEEPEWLSEEARSLISDMLQQDPAQRPSIEAILTHPWFMKTLYDNLQAASSSMDRSNPSSPLPNEAKPQFSEPFHAGASTSSSYPFSRTHSPLVHQSGVFTAPPRADSEPSEVSLDLSEERRRASGDTTPTTAEDDTEANKTAGGGVGLLGEGLSDPESTAMERTHSGEFSMTERALELLHSNESQTTIRRPGSESPRSLTSMRGKVAIKPPLEGQQEEEEEDTPADLPTFDDAHSLHLPTAGHSRTPARTKRRSVSSQLSLERRHSHHSGQWQIFPPEDFLSSLTEKRPALFTTPSERRLLHQLSDLGIDTGQLVHSVTSDACDISAATWWILRIKQMERGETDEVVTAREASQARRRERAAAYSREERRKARAAKEASLAAVGTGPSAASSPDIRAMEPPALMVSEAEAGNVGTLLRPLTESPKTMGPSASVRAAAAAALAESSLSRSAPPGMSSALPQTPPREPRGMDPASSPASDASPRERKTRSPSMSMLQRATSALVGGKRDEKRADEREVKDGAGNVVDLGKRGDSPTKLTKLPPKPAGMQASGGNGANGGGSGSLLGVTTGGANGAGGLGSSFGAGQVSGGMSKSESDSTLLGSSLPHSPETSPRGEHSVLSTSPASAAMSLGATIDSHVSGSTDSSGGNGGGGGSGSGSGQGKQKGNKRDSLWSTFRYLFDDKRRRKRDHPGSPLAAEIKPGGTTVVLSRGISARAPHNTRTPQPAPGSRRTSLERPVYSRRSSSVASRRSSVASAHMAEFAFNPAGGDGLNYGLGRHPSRRSTGSMTPTSDREYTGGVGGNSSRPSSSHSLHRGSSRRSSTSIRSPSMQSDTSGRFRAQTSPLHSYHRRATSGSASTRVRHIKVIHETQTLRPSSMASSTRSNNSSRASSLDRGDRGKSGSGAGWGGAGDTSDYDTGDAASIRSHRRHASDDVNYHHPHHPHFAALAAHGHIIRARSPLAYADRSSASSGSTTAVPHHHGHSHRAKAPLRDVFQNKGDEDWESEEEGVFVGGLGQAKSVGGAGGNGGGSGRGGGGSGAVSGARMTGHSTQSRWGSAMHSSAEGSRGAVGLGVGGIGGSAAAQFPGSGGGGYTQFPRKNSAGSTSSTSGSGSMSKQGHGHGHGYSHSRSTHTHGDGLGRNRHGRNGSSSSERGDDDLFGRPSGGGQGRGQEGSGSGGAGGGAGAGSGDRAGVGAGGGGKGKEKEVEGGGGRARRTGIPQGRGAAPVIEEEEEDEG